MKRDKHDGRTSYPLQRGAIYITKFLRDPITPDFSESFRL